MFNSQFSISQKVFVKVRGCPFWPGIICNEFHTNGKYTYSVYLYSIDIFVEVTKDDLRDYHQYFHKHSGRISSRLLFANAIQMSILHTTKANRNVHGSQYDDKLVKSSPKKNKPTSHISQLRNHWPTLQDDKFWKIELFFVKSSKETESRIKRQLKIELKFLLYDFLIKSYLRISRANYATCLNVMNKLLELPLNKLILKKYPHVVKTVLNLRKYKGNLNKRHVTLKQKLTFMKHAREIRNKAERILRFFKNIFNISKNVDFIKSYSKEVLNFHREVSNLNNFSYLC